MSDLPSLVRAHARHLLGSVSARKMRSEDLRRHSLPVSGIRRFFDMTESVECADTGPVFILSAGWRSGSTLLQRLVSSGDGILIWGEAFDRVGLIQRLAESLAPISEKWPPRDYMNQPVIEDVSKVWAANLYPPIEDLRQAYRAALTSLFGEPAVRLGAKQWGLKEVRFGLSEALFLKGVFPEAKFLFIQRDLHSAYRSYLNFSSSMQWYERWPEKPTFTPYAFGRHWGRLSTEFECAVPETGGMLIIYEDLVTGRTNLSELERYIGTRTDSSVLNNRVGSAKGQRTVSAFERLMLDRGKRAGMHQAHKMLSSI